ncbi:MAG: hypothetical protein KGL39_41770 [Patescibacteria group bacterium]|nr:hypothetical protein [Patescibacteria group bacterium]
MIQKLSSSEQKRYAACKEQISSGLQTCFDTGAALIEIRDSKLFREDFNTFEKFCQQTYKIGRAHAYRLIEASEMKMSPIGDKIETESQARALAKVPAESRPEVMKAVVESGEVTAKAITVAAKKIIDVEVVQLDKTGWPIPEKLISSWDDATNIAREFLNLTSKMKTALTAAQDKKSTAFNEVVFSAAIANCQSLYGDWKRVLPYAVCPTCQGKTFSSCAMCKKRGFISEFYWNQCVPQEVKTLRSKILKGK